MSSIALAAVTDFTTKPECHKKKGQHTIQSANPIDISPLCSKMQLNLLTAGYLTKEVKQSIGTLQWRPCNGIRTSYHWPGTIPSTTHSTTVTTNGGLPQPRDLEGGTITVTDLTKKVQADTLTTTPELTHHHGPTRVAFMG